MRAFHFDAAGVSRTYLDFYLGFGFVTGVYLLMQAVVFWQLASIAKTGAFRVRSLIGSFLLANVVSAFLHGDSSSGCLLSRSPLLRLVSGLRFMRQGKAVTSNTRLESSLGSLGSVMSCGIIRMGLP
jgi:hypothetical protein